IIGIIVGVLVAAILIVPLFSPAIAEVSSEIEIALEPAQVFPSVASFENRDAWDPWLATDTTAVATIESKPGYVGSTYAWEGTGLGSGKVEVVSVMTNERITSILWFAGMEIPSHVSWHFDPVEGGTGVVWSFAQETTYPFGRLGMIFGKRFLKQSYDRGLIGLKAFLEANPPEAGPLGDVAVEEMPSFEAMVASGSGTMEEMAKQLGDLYGKLFAEVGRQQLEVKGPPFIHYIDFDQTTGHSNYLAGVPVGKPGSGGDEVNPRSYPDMKVVITEHYGQYENFDASYGLMQEYVARHALEVTGEAFEFYTVGMHNEKDPAKWKTTIVFPLR
ncbi:MAG: GyrI-like domain-containing protein, partial [Bacteroidota bacterium]